MIITFGVELVKLGNECLQLYEHTTTMFLARLQYFHKIKFNLTKLVIINHALNKVTEKKRLLLQSVKYMEACVTTPDWLNKFHSFFSASFLLAKESETFIFLGIFCNLLVQSFLNFQSRVGWLFCENNQKWPKTKHCFDNFDSSDTFDSRDSNERFWEIFSKVKIRKTKIRGFEELKMLLRFVEERILCIYKS